MSRADTLNCSVAKSVSCGSAMEDSNWRSHQSKRRTMKIPSLNKNELLRLQQWANTISGYYGVPVYLCGSALLKKNPRDYDIRICLDDRDFVVRYGSSTDLEKWCAEKALGMWDHSHWAWSDDCVKRTKNGWAETQRNIDFQIQPEYQWDMYKKLPRVRLDTRKEKQNGQTHRRKTA